MARKVKTTPATATTTTKVEDNKEKVNEVKEVKPIEKSEVVQETPKTKKTTKGKRKFTIYYDNAMIPGVYIFGQRPKQAATKALNVILKRFFTKDKEFDVSVIGKEIKFYIEEVIKTDTTEKVNRFYYKGSKNYIVTEETMKKYESKKVKIEKDKDGIYGIVAEHKGANGSVKKIMHKFINKVNVDKEATNEAKRKKKEEQKKIKEDKKETQKQVVEKDTKQPETVEQKDNQEVKQEDKTENKKEEVKKTRKRKQQQ